MSRDFNGSTGQIGLPAAILLLPVLPVTVAAWVRPDTLKAAGIFNTNHTTATHRGLWVNLSVTGSVESSYGDNTGTASTDRRSKLSSSTLTTGAWQHVACCMRGATDMDILFGGVDAGGVYSGTGGAILSQPGVGGLIGQISGASFFDGRIAEVGLWNVSLSAAEVLALAKGVSPLHIRPNSLLGYWPVYGQSSTEIDLTPNNNPGTVSGTAPLADHAPVGSPYTAAA